ncbi:sulfite exporter TauE/SafE family protein [Stakelama saccharophila]|uniref:Probable membrane transporter protein n=1 Tax=Stakelama saccharophila TaxID=3075605 RepID=A0ABZ0BBF2_9SPHN|nr:sulfite exporter TauE/SafE family protein [Stakelama sp. W311]WNO54173.1 sulfite exporter TauE/SafE family protein [Stakelama sp. W311]
MFSIILAAGGGFLGGAMNALAGGGSFATMPTLIALGLPATQANATSNFALLPGAGASALTFRDELGPIGSAQPWPLVAITFACALVGSLLLVVTPTETFDIIIPWLLLVAFLILLFGKRAAIWLHDHVTIGRRTLFAAQALLGIYGGYFGGGIGMMMTAVYGLLAGATPREMFAARTLMLAVANTAAAFVFIGFDMIRWWACLPMLAGALAGGWIAALLGKRVPPTPIRLWTIAWTAAVTAMFFWRAYG